MSASAANEIVPTGRADVGCGPCLRRSPDLWVHDFRALPRRHARTFDTALKQGRKFPNPTQGTPRPALAGNRGHRSHPGFPVRRNKSASRGVGTLLELSRELGPAVLTTTQGVSAPATRCARRVRPNVDLAGPWATNDVFPPRNRATTTGG